MSFFIEISSPNKKNVRLMLTESHLVIGRSGVCDFVIDDPYVSGTHIELWVENETAHARDLNSSNGSSCNGKPIDAAVTLNLSNEDRIDVAGGKATILVSEHVDSLESKNVSPPPSGTVTFLFSDMFGSTDLVRELGDIKSREISRMHEDILSDTIRKHEGYIVKEMGDGFMAAFASSRSAVLCAIAIQNNLFKLREREKELPINVRIGLNTGEAILENGDYFGRAVNEAARVSAKALADQILITAVTKRMADSAGDIEFGDALEFELKGLPGIHTMYEVQWN